MIHLKKIKIKLSLLKKITFLALFPWIACAEAGHSKLPVVQVPHQTLIVSSNGRLIHFNLDDHTVTWEQLSKADSSGNRNHFTFDEKHIYLPFESGKFIAADIISGKIIWSQLPVSSNGGMDAAMDSDGEIADQDHSESVYYMGRPLLWKDKIYMASFNEQPKLWVINKADGSIFASDYISTRFNMYQPVVCRNSVFINSGPYLDMYSERGTLTSYGMYDDSAFESPLYTQMQSDGKALYLGDENGVFYAIPFTDGPQVLGENDIMDPNNTFQGRTDIYKWKFQSGIYPSLAENFNSHTALEGDQFIVLVKKAEESKEHALLSIDKNSGKLRWTYAFQEELIHWNVVDQEILAYHNSELFILDLHGQLKQRITIDQQLKPLSNIQKDRAGNLLYATEKGIVLIDVTLKKSQLKIPYSLTRNYHNYTQIQYFGNQ